MELVFVIDSSESVGPENFEIIKDFVIALVDRVTVGRNATRIGLVLYSLEVRLEFGLNKYPTRQDVKRAIRKIKYMGEGTHTGTAIHKTTQEGFSGARAGVRKVAIVLTDGQTDKREAVKLDLVVREAHAANIEMYAIGILNTSDPTQVEFVRELNLIASDPDGEHVYLIDDFNTLSGAFIEVLFYLISDASHKGAGWGKKHYLCGYVLMLQSNRNQEIQIPIVYGVTLWGNMPKGECHPV